jgi:hypothetical protein
MWRINLLRPVEVSDVRCWHVHEWVDAREEVPTVKNGMIPGQSAGTAAAWSHTAVRQDIGLPGAVPAPGTNAGGLLAVDRRRPRLAGPVVEPQLASKKYQDMTRFAAHSGDRSGPYPAWDPV